MFNSENIASNQRLIKCLKDSRAFFPYLINRKRELKSNKEPPAFFTPLRCAFIWRLTPEGQIFWENIALGKT